MDKDDNKRIMDGPITTSMRSDGPTPESIAALRERYALYDRVTAKKPAEPFDSVLAQIEYQSHDEPVASDTALTGASPSSVTSQEGVDGGDTFERVLPAQVARKGPVPTARHPDTPKPGGKGKVVIKA